MENLKLIPSAIMVDARNIYDARFQIEFYYSYTILWIALVSDLFALCALFLRSRHSRSRAPSAHRTTLIFLLKWQYIIGLLYTLNAILNDTSFSYNLFGYQVKRMNSNLGCKLQNFFEKFFYSLSPWIQVV